MEHFYSTALSVRDGNVRLLIYILEMLIICDILTNKSSLIDAKYLYNFINSNPYVIFDKIIRRYKI